LTPEIAVIKTSRLTYRIHQFRHALRIPTRVVATASIRPYLSEAQLALFRQMQASEQFHAYATLQQLKNLGQSDPDLLTAALLHDIGKIIYPLSAWERAAIVLGKRFFPRSAQRWGEGRPRGFHRPFVVAARHAEWGADLADRAGASRLAVTLIQRHQEPLPVNPNSREDRLLNALQSADDTH